MSAAPPQTLGTEPSAAAAGVLPGVLNGHDRRSQATNGPAGQHRQVVRHKKKHPHQAAKYVFPLRTGDLAVSPGQITFEAEGTEQESSPYFSRKIIWPGTAADGVGKGSGVTIGRGYDMGDRTEKEVTTDLTAAGMDAKTAAAFAKGAGLQGPGTDDKSAEGFVKNHRAELGTITTAVQKKLFQAIYPSYAAKARERYHFHATHKAVQWELLKAPIRDVLVDFVYQGFGQEKKGYGRPLQAGMNNDYQELIDYIHGSATMRGYEAGRHRADYLTAAQAAEKIALPKPLLAPPR